MEMGFLDEVAHNMCRTVAFYLSAGICGGIYYPYRVKGGFLRVARDGD